MSKYDHLAYAIDELDARLRKIEGQQASLDNSWRDARQAVLDRLRAFNDRTDAVESSLVGPGFVVSPVTHADAPPEPPVPPFHPDLSNRDQAAVFANFLASKYFRDWTEPGWEVMRGHILRAAGWEPDGDPQP